MEDARGWEGWRRGRVDEEKGRRGGGRGLRRGWLRGSGEELFKDQLANLLKLYLTLVTDK